MSGDTIAAIASPPGGGERGIVRVSGPRAKELVLETWRGDDAPDLARRGFALGRFDDGRGTQPLLLLWMPAPHSFTREDVAEFHLPGSPPLLRAALARLLELGARSARAGEFTRRALESGRIDLTRAEGVLALVSARNDAEARAAARLVFGGVDERIVRAREALDGARALVEASLDFGEDDTGHVPAEEIEALLAACEREIDAALALAAGGERASAVSRAVLAGLPNAGKSSLFNALLGRSGALVSDVPGTTRDALVAELDLGDISCELVDAPGLDAGARGLEASAQEIASAQRTSADLVVWVVDAARAGVAALEAARRALSGVRHSVLVWNKIDLPDAAPRPTDEWRTLASAGIAAVSARDGSGLEKLRERLRSAIANEEASPLRDVAARHRIGLEAARRDLELARIELESGAALELVAERLRLATAGLDDVAGHTSAEDLLDRIFSRFCLGK